MSDTVTIHNGHCSYHGPADKAPAWAARAAALAPAKWHDLKIHPQPLSDLLSGAKTGELRRDDRGYQVGDGVHLTCPDGREARYLISHIQRGYGLPDELVVLSYRAPAPAPLTSFEDTTHAWEEGYRAGRAEGCGQKIQQKLQRFAECADDGEDVDIGREWLDALSTLGFLVRSQRSPARWVMTEIGERTLSAGPMGKEIW